MADLEALIARVEKLKGPDRDTDFAVARWEGWTQHTDEDDPVYCRRVSTWWAEPGREWSTCSNPPAYTASLDAAVALVERVLPGERWEVSTTGFLPGASIIVSTPLANHGAYAATPAIALVLATLRALQSTAPAPPSQDDANG